MRGQLPPGLGAVLSTRVRALRAARGWSLGELGKKTGTDRRQVNRLELGEANMDLHLSTLANLAHVFGITMGQLLDGDPNDIPDLPPAEELEPIAEIPSMTDFGKQLAALREARGWTQAELAKRSSTHHTQISRMEWGNVDPKFSTAIGLAKGLGVPLGALIGEASATSPAREGLEAIATVVQLLEQAARSDVGELAAIGLALQLGPLESAMARLAKRLNLREAPPSRIAPPDVSKLAKLTPREREVFDLVAEGMSGNEIAAKLGLGISTIRTHLGSIYRVLGTAHSTADVVRFAHGLEIPKAPVRTDSGLEKLSAREREVFDLIVDGATNAGIAKKLGLSIKTVQTHRAKINRKVGAHSTADVLRFAAARGMLPEANGTRGEAASSGKVSGKGTTPTAAFGVRVLVIGSRSKIGNHRRVIVRKHLDALQAERGVDMVLQNGGSGVESYARSWAKDNRISYETYDGVEKPDVVIAFPGGRSTTDLARRLRKANVEVREIDVSDGWDVTWPKERRTT